MSRIARTLVIALAASAVLPGARAAQKLGALPDSRLWLEGDSTLHAFASTATRLSASLEFAPASGEDPAAAVRAGRAATLDLIVPVEGLKSGEKGLDKNLYAALKSDKNPEIAFHMNRYEVRADSASAAGELKAYGTLSIAGSKREVELHGDGQFEGSALRVRGVYELMMSAYGVKPPTLMMGMIKVKDKVAVHFDLHLGPDAPARQPSAQ